MNFTNYNTTIQADKSTYEPFSHINQESSTMETATILGVIIGTYIMGKKIINDFKKLSEMKSNVKELQKSPHYQSIEKYTKK